MCSDHFLDFRRRLLRGAGPECLYRAFADAGFGNAAADFTATMGFAAAALAAGALSSSSDSSPSS